MDTEAINRTAVGLNINRIRQLVEKGLEYGPAPESPDEANAWLDSHQRRFGHFINGEFRDAIDGRTFTTKDPSTGKELATIALGTTADVDAAVAAATEAFTTWSLCSGYRRARVALAIARVINKWQRPLAVLESMDNGKTIRETRDIDVPLVIRHLYHYAGWAAVQEEEFPNYKPGGVVAQIIPWNFPALMWAWKVAPAIAAGNTVVLKPSEYTPLSAVFLMEKIAEEVRELPPGVINIVHGDGKTGAALVAHPIPWKIAFTGSTEVGRLILTVTAGTDKRVTLELGGKNPSIIFDDVDLDAVVEGVVDAILNYGQVCCSGTKLLVQESIFPEFCRRVRARMGKLRGGVPLDKNMDFGAVNSAAQLEKIEKLVAQGREQGAEIYQPDGWSCPEGCYAFPPTLAVVEPANILAREEIFGPVLTAMSFRDPAEAIRLANNTQYGLAASIWTSDGAKALAVAAQVKAGSVWINSTNLFDANAPFGGFKESGHGREGGRDGYLAYLVENIPSTREQEPVMDETTAAALYADTVTNGDELDRTDRYLIDGKLARPDGGSSYQQRDSSNRFLRSIGNANRKDIRNAVAAARKVVPAWGGRTQHNRAQVLCFLAENLSKKHVREQYAAWIALQTGRTLESARNEVASAIERLFYWAGYADKFGGETLPVNAADTFVATINTPIGVVGIQPPDDYPLLAVNYETPNSVFFCITKTTRVLLGF